MSGSLVYLIRLLMAECQRTNRQMSIPEMRFIIGGISPSALKEFDKLLWSEFIYKVSV